MKNIGKYKITSILGKGAMGIVYKALDPDINRDVAIKTIRFDLVSEEGDREEMMERFMREAQAAGKLTHSNIITIYDVGRENFYSRSNPAHGSVMQSFRLCSR